MTYNSWNKYPGGEASHMPPKKLTAEKLAHDIAKFMKTGVIQHIAPGVSGYSDLQRIHARKLSDNIKKIKGGLEITFSKKANVIIEKA